MKVLLVTPNFHQPRGNTVTVQRIADGLKKSDVQTDIISITEENLVKTLPKAEVVHGFHAYHFYKFLEKLDTKPASYIITLTGTDLNHHLFDEKTREDVIFCLRNAKAIHVFNQEAKHILLKELPEVKHKTAIIPQGTTEIPDKSLQQPKEDDTFLFVLAAGIRKVKNIPFAIESLRSLYEKNSKVRLWLVGPILEEAEGEVVKELLQANKKWVSYLGKVPHKKMGVIYTQADCVLNTSHSEGQPASILEAMSSCLPVLVSNNQGNRSIVSHRETGFIYTTSNQFLDYAEQILNNIELRQTIGENAKQYIAENHSSEKEAKQLIQIYQNTRK
ncbi:glycosyltransferase [Virgibacillus ndiopensis]|uniref:glycosyltransferase n=1 Tax=Virgibacillus ndiopensis TaxID=2004408 RepID=UPI00159BB605|nr:glycosyltransferase [Virgibacillus ndiopensis]